MFQKVLISDDFGSINQGVLTVLEEVGVTSVKQVQYCDDAYLQIKSAFFNEDPYDLFITDLNFKEDHREQKYASGEAIIEQLKKEHPHLKIIVYSVEDRLQKVRHLIHNLKVNAFVCKGRNGLVDLAAAIDAVHKNIVYLSPQVQPALSTTLKLEINEYYLELLNLLAQGYSKESINKVFIEKNLTPSSLSSIEKRQNKLCSKFKANNTAHLVAIVKDLGLI
jgi:DNA-binding NarL/FixJ family response regulator